MAHVWVLYDSGVDTTQLFRADAIEELRGTGDQLDALLSGSGGQRSTLLHISGRSKLPAEFAIDLLKTTAQARAEHPNEDTVVVAEHDAAAGSWNWRTYRLAEYQLPPG